MWSVVVDVFRVFIWLTLLTAVFATLERLFSLRPSRVLRPQLLADVGYFFLSSLLPSVLLGAPLAAIAWAAHRIVPADLHAAVVAAPLWLRIAAAFVIGKPASIGATG